MLFIAWCNGRIDIKSHIVKTQEIILINLKNTIVQSVVMSYSHILMVMLGEEVGKRCGLGEWGHYFLLTKFFKIHNMFKIFYMMALGSYVTFSPNLSKYYRRKGSNFFLTDLSEISFPFFEGGGGGCKICQLRMMKTLTNQNWSRGKLA